MCMGVYVAFGSIFPAGLGSEWEENVHVKSEPEVGKGAQASTWILDRLILPSYGNVSGVQERGGDCERSGWLHASGLLVNLRLA